MDYALHGVLAPFDRGKRVTMIRPVDTDTKRPWQPMALSHVGDVSVVMQKKSGPHFDPSPVHLNKRGLGPK